MQHVTSNTLIIYLFQWVELFLQHYIYQGYHAISHVITLPLGVAVSLYIAVYGYALATGIVSMRLGYFFQHLFRLSMMYLMATQWSYVSSWLVNGVYAITDGLAAAELSANPLHIPTATDIKTALQSTFTQINFIGNQLWRQGNLFSNPSPMLTGLLIWIEGTLLVAIGTCEILIAKMVLAILFTLTPAVALLTLWPALRSVFDRWIGAIITCIFVQVLTTAVLIIGLSLAYTFTTTTMVDRALSGQAGLGLGWAALIIAVLCIVLIFRAQTLAMSLGSLSTGASATLGLATGLGNVVNYSMTITRFGIQSSARINPFRRR